MSQTGNITVYIDPQIFKSVDFIEHLKKINELGLSVKDINNLSKEDHSYNIFIVKKLDKPFYRRNYTSRHWFINITDEESVFHSDKKNLFEFDPRNLEGVIQAIYLIVELYETENINQLLKQSSKHLSEITKMAKRYSKEMQKQLKSRNVSDERSKICVHILEFYYLLLDKKNEEDLVCGLEIFNQSELFSEVRFLSIHQTCEALSLLDSGSYLMPLLLSGEVKFIAVKINSSESHDFNGYCMYLLRTVIIFTLWRMNKFSTSNIESSVWEEGFSKIEIPLAMISSRGELLVYNSSFLKVNILPIECLSIVNNGKIERENAIFKVFRNDFDSDGDIISVFSFVSEIQNELSDKKNISSSELGIISSSVAHELNNPLAGILAAISLLELEDDWSEEEKNSLEDLKSAGRRCKDLVEMFLGFSKTNTWQQQKGSIKKSFTQALSLLRFRMIESDVRLSIDDDIHLDRFNKQINTSIMAMVFYLIFNEVITSFSHFRLVALDVVKDSKMLSGNIICDSTQIEIILDQDFDFSLELKNSKLIQHLLGLENLSVSTTNNIIMIS